MHKRGKTTILADIIAISFLILAILIFFYDFIFEGFIFFHGDLPSVHYPLKSFFKEEITRGYIPLWNPYTGAGSPVFAQAEILPFYIFNILIFLLFPITSGFTVMVVLHLFMGGLFTYIFLRLIGLKSVASIISAIAFVFSAYSIFHIHIIHLLCGAMWVPLILIFIELYIKHRKIYLLLLGSLGHIIQLSGSHPQATVYSFLVTVSYLAWRFFTTTKEQRIQLKIRNFILLFIIFQAPISLLSAVEIVPIVELTPLSLRQGGVSTALTGHTVPSDLITYIFPTWFLGRDNSKIGAVLSHTSFYYDFASYVGIITLLLAFLAIFRVNNSFVSFFTILFFTSSLLRLGFLTPLYSIIMCIPGFNFLLSPTRFSQITTLSLTILSGFGFTSLLDRKDCFSGIKEFSKKRLPAIIYYILFMIYPVFTGHAWIRCIKVKPPITFLGVHTIPQILIALVFIVLLLFKKKKRLFTIATILLITSDLFLYGINYNPRIHPSEALAPTEIVQHLKEEKGNFRIYQFYKMGQFAKEKFVKYDNLILTPDLNAYNGISSTLSRLSFRLKRLEQINDVIFRELYDILYRIRIQKVFPRLHSSINNPQPIEDWNKKSTTDKGYPADLNPPVTSIHRDHPLLDLSNIRYILTPYVLKSPDFKIISEQPIKVYENKSYMERAFFVTKGIKVINDDILLKNIRNRAVNFKEEVCIEDDDKRMLYDPVQPEYRCVIVNYEPLQIEIEVITNKSGYLVLSDTFYPGWIASINEIPAKILRANYFFRGIRLDEPGKYHVNFEFKPFSYKLGLYISLFSITISCALIFILILTRKKNIEAR